MENVDFLKSIDTFSNLADSDYSDLANYLEEKSFPKDHVIFTEESPGDSMSIVKEGRVKIAKNIKGKEQTLIVLNSGDFFGEMSLFDERPRSASSIAIEDATLVVLNRKNLATMKKEKPELVIKLMEGVIRILSNRLRQADKNMEIISFWFT